MKIYQQLGLAAAGACIVGVLNAQAQSPSSSADNAGLADIVVTAERREESLQKTPIAVTALSASMLEDANVRTTLDLMQVTPGLEVATQTAGDGGLSATFFLRGFGQQRAGNGSQPAVGIYVDDFYYPSLEGAVFNILDLRQVEVLRGPQGTLFGRDTIGGAIRYTTAKPEFDFDAKGTVTFGNYGRQDYVGVVNVPLGDRTAVRLTVGSLEDDGFVRQETAGPDAGGVDSILGRIQLRSKPIDGLTIDLQAQFSREHEYGFPYSTQAPIIQVLPGALPPLQAVWNGIPPLGGANPYDGRYLSTCAYCQPGGTGEYSKVENHNFNAVVAWDILHTLQLKSLTGYTDVQTNNLIDLDGSVLPILSTTSPSSNGALTQEFQLNGSAMADRLKYVSGAYIFDQKISNYASAATVLAGPATNAASTTFIKSYAAYFDLTAQIFERLSGFGGYRYSAERQTIESTQVARTSFPGSTGRLGFQYQWTPSVMTYASVSQGFRSGGANVNPVGSIHTYKPETDVSYEVGARLEFFDHRLRVNPTAFFNDWRDIQVQFVQPFATIPAIFLANAAKAHTYGFELELQGAITDNFNLFGNLSTLHAEYISVGTAQGIITTDSRFERAPSVTYNFGGAYTIALPWSARLVSTLNWSWQSEQASTPSDGPLIDDTLNLPKYGLLNGRIAYRSNDDRYSVALFGRNLLNKLYYVGGANFAPTSGAAQYDLGAPRQYGVTLEYRYR